MFEKTIRFFDTLMRRYTPDPFILSILLTMIVFVLVMLYTPTSAEQMLSYWGDGLWDLASFTLKMSMVLLTGYVIAIAPAVEKKLCKIASWTHTPGQAIVVITYVSAIASLINWGFGLVVGGLLCRHMIQCHPQANFRLMVAASYSGFLVWHGGVSASIPLSLATEGNFAQGYVGQLIPINFTLLSPLNLWAVGGLFILLPICNWLMMRCYQNTHSIVETNQSLEMSPASILSALKSTPKKTLLHTQSFVEWCENRPFVAYCVSGVGLLYLYFLWKKNVKVSSLDLDIINTFFLFFGLYIHRTPRSFLNAVNEAAGKIGPILIQFPFYAGIMSLVKYSGLATVLAEAFVQFSTQDTYTLWTFYSAGLLNLFIPSGGGQWAIQAPIVIQSAKAIGADIPKAAMAVAWGDAWTNMLQPFWALPLLAIAGLHLRDIMGYCVIILAVSGLYLSGVFLFF